MSQYKHMNNLVKNRNKVISKKFALQVEKYESTIIDSNDNYFLAFIIRNLKYM